MKRILVPCDFSPPAVEAFKFAEALAKKAHGQIHVLYAVSSALIKNAAAGLSGHTSFPEVMMQRLEAEMNEKFTFLKEEFSEPERPIKFRIELGTLIAAIESVCFEETIDLVVMGTQGASGLKEMLIGSNTEKVVRHSRIPVVAVPLGARLDNFCNIVFPVDPTQRNLESVKELKTLQNFFHAKIHLLWINTPHIFKSDTEALEDLQEFVNEHHFSNFELHTASEHTEHEGIQKFVRKINADLLFMPTHGRKGIVHWLTGSITEKVVNHVQCPVWTISMKN